MPRSFTTILVRFSNSQVLRITSDSASINESQVYDVDLDFSLEFLETNEVTGALAHEGDYFLQTSHGVKCSQSYSTRQEVAILDCNDVQLYSKRSILEREVLHKINVTVRDVSLSVSDVSVLFSTINPKFTQTLIWLRFACLLSTFVAFLFFLASLKRLSPAKRLGEHKWLLLMFITLLLYQDSVKLIVFKKTCRLTYRNSANMRFRESFFRQGLISLEL
jgi:hypothetical protein